MIDGMELLYAFILLDGFGMAIWAGVFLMILREKTRK
jgi:hypothetical protein